MNKSQVIRKLLDALAIALDQSGLENGDPFGIHHNDVMDTMAEAEAILIKEGRGDGED